MICLWSWITTCVCIIIMASISPAISTWSCVDDTYNGLLNCDPDVIRIKTVIPGKETCMDRKSVCHDTVGSMDYVRQQCHTKPRCFVDIKDANRPECAAGNASFYLNITYSCSETGVATSTATTTSAASVTTPTSPTMTRTYEVTITETPPITPDSQANENDTKNKSQTPKVLVIALPVAVLLIVVVIIIVLIIVLRKRTKKQETDSLPIPTGTNDTSDVNGPSRHIPRHGELRSVHDNTPCGQDGRDDISYSFAQGVDEHELSAYSTAYKDTAAMARVDNINRASHVYDELQRDTQRYISNDEEEQSRGPAAFSPTQLDINDEEQSEADITDIYSVVNTVPRHPDELELHDNPMYGIV